LHETEKSGKFRILHNEALRDLYGLTFITRVVKSMRLRWTDQVVHVGEISNAQKFGTLSVGIPMRWEVIGR
jgi:hypothetical protein